MKAITLHQPWASLIALGVKAIETRSWSTSYRGPLAIHAGLTRPPLMHLPPLWSRGSTREEQEALNSEAWMVIDTISDPAYQGPQPQGRRVPKRAQTPTLFFPHAGQYARPGRPDGVPATEFGSAMYLPLGAVVATCDLVDVIPTQALTWVPDGGIGGDLPWGVGDRCAVVVESQRPYGDYRAGRFAWLLGEVEPIEPSVPARGHQQLWDWGA